jgi:hypothetical protein
MTPTERAALLLKVQRALDAKEIGRDGISGDIDSFTIDGGANGLYLEFRDSHAELSEWEPYGVDCENELWRTTFTFGDLFRELEWQSYGDDADGFLECELPDVTFQIWHDAPSVLVITGRHDNARLFFRTPERAKRAAQSIADLLAEAGRES